jgi:hypothetical protein
MPKLASAGLVLCTQLLAIITLQTTIQQRILHLDFIETDVSREAKDGVRYAARIIRKPYMFVS